MLTLSVYSPFRVRGVDTVSPQATHLFAHGTPFQSRITRSLLTARTGTCTLKDFVFAFIFIFGDCSRLNRDDDDVGLNVVACSIYRLDTTVICY